VSAGSLGNVALSQLEHLLRLFTTGGLAAPLSHAALQARGLGPCWSELAWLADLDSKSVQAVLQVAIAERTTRPVPRLELVWTGPEAKVSPARDTAVVLRQLFGQARSSVLVAGFSFSSGADIFQPLFEVMRDHAVDASVFLHIDDLPGLPPDESAKRGIDRFLRDNWPFGPPTPTVYYDPRTVAAGSSINLHAKCVVVDARWSLVGSANFTHNAHVRNIEVGVLIEDASFATALIQQWRGLIDARLVTGVV